MTPDDEALARVRAALHTIADRTPISGGRLDEISVAATEKRSRPVVTIVSAAAAVAAIAAVSAVVVGAHSDAARSVRPSSGDGLGAAASPAASSPVGQSATPTITVTPSPTPIATPTITATPSPLLSTANCVPENYYVTASPSELAGLTYLLPATPTGYRLYGAWGTISRNQCADSVTWYVQYNSTSTADDSDAIQLSVAKVGGDSVAGGFATATPIAATPITIGGNQGFVIDKESSHALIGWTSGGAAITLDGPVSHGDIASLVQVANSLVLVNPNDPRIVAPADCQVPAGSVCGSDSPTAVPSPTPTPSPSPTS